MPIDRRWAAVVAVVLATPVVMMLWPRVPADDHAPAAGPVDAPAPPAARVTPLVRLSSDQAVARAVAAEQALARAQTALKAANFALSTPDIPPRKPVWSTAVEDNDMPQVQLSPQIEHAEVVRLPDPASLEKAPGDRLTVPLFDGRSLAVTVEDASRLPNGDYSWRGYVDGEGDDFPVIFTVGKNSAFATITSWEGSYTMESVGGVGWLYKNIIDRGEDAVLAPVDEGASRYN